MKRLRYALSMLMSLLLILNLFVFTAVGKSEDFSIAMKEVAVDVENGIYKMVVSVKGYADTTGVSVNIIYNSGLISPVNKDTYKPLEKNYHQMLEYNEDNFSCNYPLNINELSDSYKGFNIVLFAYDSVDLSNSEQVLFSFYYKVSNPDAVIKNDLRLATTDSELYTSSNIQNSASVIIFSETDRIAIYNPHSKSDCYENAEIIENVTFTHQGSSRQTLGSITINKINDVAVPIKGNIVLSNTPVVKQTDVDGDDMNSAQTLTWSIVGDEPAGVSIDAATGVLTIKPIANAGTVTVKAIAGSVSAIQMVTITKAESVATEIQVYRAGHTTPVSTDSLIIPPSGTLEQIYTAKIFDQYGFEIAGANVTWDQVSNYFADIDFDFAGKVIINSTTQQGTYEFKAFSGNLSKTVAVNISRAAQVLTSIRIFDDSNEKTTDIIAVPTLEQNDAIRIYTAIGYDQYGIKIIDQPNFTWSLENAAAGVTQTDGVVTVAKGAEASTSIILKATSGSVAGTMTLKTTRDAQAETYINFSRDGLISPIRGTDDGDDASDKLVLPVTGTADYTYTAIAYDQYGTVIESQNLTWSVERHLPYGTTVRGNVVTLTGRDNVKTETGSFLLKVQGTTIVKAITINITDIVFDWSVLDDKLNDSITYGDTNSAVKKIDFPSTGTAAVGETQLEGVFSIKDENINQEIGSQKIVVIFTITSGGIYQDVKLEKEFNVTVNPRDISNALITLIADQPFTGAPIEPVPVVTDTVATITADDYTVIYESNTNVGTATLKITGKGNYTGEKTTIFQITKVSAVIVEVDGIAANSLSGSVTIAKANASNATSYSDFKLPASVKFQIEDGNYSEIVTAAWDIDLAALKSETIGSVTMVKISNIPSWIYINDTEITVNVQIIDKYPVDVTVTQAETTYGTALDSPVANAIGDGVETNPQWTYLYTGVNGTTYNGATPPVNSGSYIVTATLVSDTHKGEGTSSVFTIAKKTLTDSMITLNASDIYTYNKMEYKPDILVSDIQNETELIKSADYSVSYEDNINAGTAKLVVTATANGNYTGNIEKNFTIAKTDISDMAPDISGINKVGNVLLVSLNDVETDEYIIQWNLNDAAISDATGFVLSIDKDYYGKFITVTITAKENNYTGFCTSIPVEIYKAEISGMFIIVADSPDIAEGTELTANYAEVSPSVTEADLEFQWKTNGKIITEATKDTYIISVSDLGCTITAEITGTGSYTGTLLSSNNIMIPAVEPETPNLHVSAGNASITASWSDNLSGGSPIINYTISIAEASASNIILKTETLSGSVKSYTFTSLKNGTEYIVTLIATNIIGDSTPANEYSQPTAPSSLVGSYVDDQSSNPSSDGSNSNSETGNSNNASDSTNTSYNSINVIIDGKSYDNMGKLTEKDNAATLIVSQNEFQKQIDNAKESIIIPLSTTAANVTAELAIKNIEDITEKGLTLTIKMDNVNYSIPADAIDTKSIMAQSDTSNSSKIPIFITITTKVDELTGERVATAIATIGGEIIIPAIEFNVTATVNGKKQNINTFDKYVERSIEITEEQAKKVTTAVVVEPNGKTRHVPTNVYKKGAKWYASVNSRTNSTYVLIYNGKKFTDVQGKWYESAVNEMANRKIINGVSDTKFEGDRGVTRAEFCAIIVRALGLPENGDASMFKDVSKTDWYYGAIGTAYKYGIINGRDTGIFDPVSNITWQEAMVMIQRAAAVAEYKGYSGSISKFSDSNQLSSWAIEAAKFCTGSSLLSSNNNGNLNPLTDITRAETADMLLKLLQKAKLIDIR